MTTDERRDVHVLREIDSQPEAWRRAAVLADQRAAALPRRGESVAVLGCGTSWHVATAYAAMREESGAGVTDAFPASEFRSDRRYDRVVAISRSGTTTEVVDAIAACRDPLTVITSVADSPVAQMGVEVVLADFADEQSVVQTLFATTTVMLLRAGLGADISPFAAQAEQILADGAGVSEAVAAAEQVTFLGQGWAYGIAQEAALKLRESAQFWSEAYLQMEYRHGPISIAQPGRAVWILGTPVAGLVDDVEQTGATIVDDDLDPVVDLVRVQRFAVHQAQLRQLDPDQPRHLTRSVVLRRS